MRDVRGGESLPDVDVRLKAAPISFDITQVFAALVKLLVYEEEDCREGVMV